MWSQDAQALGVAAAVQVGRHLLNRPYRFERGDREVRQVLSSLLESQQESHPLHLQRFLAFAAALTSLRRMNSTDR